MYLYSKENTVNGTGTSRSMPPRWEVGEDDRPELCPGIPPGYAGGWTDAEMPVAVLLRLMQKIDF